MNPSHLPLQFAFHYNVSTESLFIIVSSYEESSDLRYLGTSKLTIVIQIIRSLDVRSAVSMDRGRKERLLLFYVTRDS